MEGLKFQVGLNEMVKLRQGLGMGDRISDRGNRVSKDWTTEMAIAFFFVTLRKLIIEENERWISFLLYKFLSFLSNPNSFLSLFLFHFLSFFPIFSFPVLLVYSVNFSVSYSSIHRHCLLILVAFRIKVAACPKFVFSIEYSTIRSAESFLNLALLLSSLINKFSLLGLTRFIMGYQKSSSDVHDCPWKLWALQPCLLPSLLTKAISLIHWQSRVKDVIGSLSMKVMWWAWRGWMQGVLEVIR